MYVAPAAAATMAWPGLYTAVSRVGIPSAASVAQAAVPAREATSLTTTSSPSSRSCRPRSTSVGVSSPQAWKNTSRAPAAMAQR